VAGRIPQAFVDELIARTDIVELIGARVPLRKAGREWKARCPFHDEKSPSFWVSPDKQFYHCFGCGAHGTSIGFLMNYDRMSFPEAVEELAQRAGLEVPREGGDTGARGPGEDLYDLVARVARFYAEELARDARARTYLERRGLDRDSIERFQIGYAPNAWNTVLNRFGTTDAARQRLLDAGLIVERERGPREGDRWYDRFRDRIMFPIRDARGRTIAFGGRILDQGEPKYLNSPETALFHKGRELYGLYEVRQSREKLERLLVVEGYVDVVRLHQAGVRHAVATLGTATTAEHLKRVFRLVSEVVFAFDGDRAGRAAAWRALQNALPEAREGREARFLFLPEGEDPDTLVGAEGREAFLARVAGALPLSEYLVVELAAQVDLGHADGRARLAELARPLVMRVPEGVYRDLLVAHIAESVKLPAARLAGHWAAPATSSTMSAGARASTGAASDAPHAPTRRPLRRAGATGRRSLLGQAIQYLLHMPSLAARLSPQLVEALERVEEPGTQVLRELLESLRADPATSTAQALERWRERPEGARLAQLAAEPLLVPDARAAASECAEAITKLVAGADRARVDALLARSRDGALSAEEKSELQRLMSNQAPVPPGAGRK
jgi:DNA primase